MDDLEVVDSGNVIVLRESGPAEALVAAGVISSAALNCVADTVASTDDDYTALMHGRHAETWLAPFTWRAIRRTT